MVMRNVQVSLRVPASVDAFFEQVRHRTLEVRGQKIQMDESKSDIYIKGLKFAIHHCEEWLKE